MNENSKVVVAGRQDVMSRAIRSRLDALGYVGLLEVHGRIDPGRSDEVDSFVSEERPEYVILTGGESGGISLNQKRPVDLLRDNVEVALSWTEAARRYGVRKLLYLASSCIYPRECPQPMGPNSLLTGRFEPTNEAYATAKFMGLVLCESYRSQYGLPFMTAILGDVFGPGDEFDSEDSHVVPALISRMHRAAVRGDAAVEIWGSGRPIRQFSYADDIADACIFLIQHYDGMDPINVSSGVDVSVAELASTVREVVGYQGELKFNTDRPDGMPVKTLDTSPLRRMGWEPSIGFREGLVRTYEAYLELERVRSTTG